MARRAFIRRKHIRNITKELLFQTGVSEPPVPVANIARGQGLEIGLDKDSSSNISGFLFLGREKPIIGVNAAHHENRQRFTIAHELGHYLLHQASSENLHVDHSFQMKLRDDLSSEGTDVEEREANLFAAELLIPADFLEQDLRGRGKVDLEDDAFLRKLARRYQVSLQSVVFRLANLGYASL